EGAESRVEDAAPVRLDAGVDGLVRAEREHADTNGIGNAGEQAAVSLFADLNRVSTQLHALTGADDCALAHDQEAVVLGMRRGLPQSSRELVVQRDGGDDGPDPVAVGRERDRAAESDRRAGGGDARPAKG